MSTNVAYPDLPAATFSGRNPSFLNDSQVFHPRNFTFSQETWPTKVGRKSWLSAKFLKNIIQVFWTILYAVLASSISLTAGINAGALLQGPFCRPFCRTWHTHTMQECSSTREAFLQDATWAQRLAWSLVSKHKWPFLRTFNKH